MNILQKITVAPCTVVAIVVIFIPFRCHSRFCPTLDFIERLRHIPEKHFKMIRYYGLYARHRESDKKLNHAITKEKRGIYFSFNKWRKCILFSFGYDPLKCSSCGNTMVFLKLYHNHHRVPLNEIYEKVMAKAKGCRSPAV